MLDVPTMREYFERGGADETGERSRSTTRLRAPIVPKKFFHTAGNFREHHEESKNVNWSHPVLPWIVFFQNVDAIIGPDEPIVYPEHLTNEMDYELELAVVIGKAGKFFSPEEADDYIAGYLDLQRHHRARHPARGDEVGRLLPLQGDRHVLPDRPVDRHARRDRRPARTSRWSCASTASRARSRTRAACRSPIPEIISHYSPMGYSRGRHPLHRHRVRRGRLLRRPDVALPQARRRGRVRDREASACCATRSSRGRRRTATPPPARAAWVGRGLDPPP